MAGVVLLAPMLALDVATPLRHILYGIACMPIVSTALLIPSSSTSAEKQYRDGAKRKECEDDPLAVNTGGKIRPASASTCVELANVSKLDIINEKYKLARDIRERSQQLLNEKIDPPLGFLASNVKG